MKWAIELSKFGLHFKSRATLKSQVLADFVVECTFNQIVQEKEDSTSWELCHNDFPLDLDDHKNNGVVIDLFCTGVIGHPVGMILNQGPKTLI